MFCLDSTLLMWLKVVSTAENEVTKAESSWTRVFVTAISGVRVHQISQLL